MAIEDSKYQAVRSGDDVEELSEGTWEYVVHDCHTPSMAEILVQKAAAGTIWKCGNCHNQWKLTLHTKNMTPLSSATSSLRWIRITPIKENEE